MINNIMLTVILALLIAVLAILYYMLKYNSNFLKQIQSIKGIQFNTMDIGQEAPIFRVHDVYGNKVITKNLFYKKNTLMLFINTKCPKCKAILESIGSIQKYYDLNIMVVNNDEMFDDSNVKKLLNSSIIYVRSSHIAMSYYIYTTPMAVLVENGNVKLYNKVPDFNTLHNLLITESVKKIAN